MIDNLYPLRVFLLVAEEAHVTRAAERLGVSQPAVSAQVKALEAHFGETLFHRQSKGLRLTPFGERVRRQTRSILNEVGELERLARGEEREVSLAVSTTPGAHWLPGRLNLFQAQQPRTMITYSIASSGEVQDQVQNHSVAFGLAGELDRRSELHYLEVARDWLQLFVGTQAESDTLILREPGSSTRAQAERLLEPILEKFTRRLALSSNEAIKEAVLAGLGTGVLSRWAVQRELEAGLLKAIEPWSMSRPIYLIRRENRELRGVARRLWDFLSA